MISSLWDKMGLSHNHEIHSGAVYLEYHNYDNYKAISHHDEQHF